jgi:hypothetical protein
LSDEERFRVGPGNTLVQVSQSQSGHLGQYERWEYEEYDPAGRIVARITEWDEVSVGAGWARRGWRKVDSAGNFLDENIEKERG